MKKFICLTLTLLLFIGLLPIGAAAANPFITIHLDKFPEGKIIQGSPLAISGYVESSNAILNTVRISCYRYLNDDPDIAPKQVFSVPAKPNVKKYNLKELSSKVSEEFTKLSAGEFFLLIEAFAGLTNHSLRFPFTIVGLSVRTGMQWPLPGYTRLSQYFTPNHFGIDIPAPKGTSIVAAEAGTVVATYSTNYNGPDGGWGSYVKIQHSPTLYTLYAHCSSLNVSLGQTVSKGQTIVRVGNTGNSTGNHLHFEVYSGGSGTGYRVNPLNYFTLIDGLFEPPGDGGATVDPIKWPPDPFLYPNSQDFYLVPPGGGSYTVTHGAWRNADMYYSQPWITDRHDDGSKSTFKIVENTSANARDGSVRAQIGEHVVEGIRYLQCAPTQTYNRTIPAHGGALTITLPNGYQYQQYGDLTCSAKPDWVYDTVIRQDGDKAPTITIFADYAPTARNGTVTVQMIHTRDGTYTVANIALSQAAFTGDTIPGNDFFADRDVDRFLISAAGGADYHVTHKAFDPAVPTYSASWMINRRDIDLVFYFDAQANNTNTARYGYVSFFNNGSEKGRIHYLQCGQPNTYEISLPQGGGSGSVTIPLASGLASGETLSRYGSLNWGSRPVWTGLPDIMMDSNSATITISAGATEELKDGTIPIVFCNSGQTASSEGEAEHHRGPFTVAYIKVKQSGRVPTGVSLNQSSLTLKVGETYMLSAVAYPTDIQNKAITWSSSDTSIATVSSEGLVTAVNAGSTSITARTVNGQTAVCPVRVTEEVTPVSVNPSHLIFDTDEHSIDNKQIIKVENGGVYSVTSERLWLQYHKEGDYLWIWCDANSSAESRTGMLTILAENGTSVTVSVKQNGTEPNPPIPKEELYNALVSAAAYQGDGGSYTAQSFDLLMGAASTGKEVFEDENAVLTQVNASTEEIYEALFGLKPVVKGVFLLQSNLSLKVNGSATLTATVFPSDATNKKVKWSSDKSSVATVNQSGKVTANAKGTATITVTTEDGGFKQTCKVTVTPNEIKVTGVKINNNPGNMIMGKTVSLNTTVLPANATKKTLKWSSGDTKIATVTSMGKVAAKQPGKVTITAAATDGSGKRSVATITVHRYVTMRIGKTTAIMNGTKTTIDKAGAKPFKSNGRTMVPIRFVGEKMGGKVKYIADNKPIVITYGGTRIELTINKPNMKVIRNGKSNTIKLDVAAQKRNGRVYLPLRAVSEALGSDVKYEVKGEYIVVNNPKMSSDVKKARFDEARKIIK